MGREQQDTGAPCGTGSRADAPSPAVSALTGFDPSREDHVSLGDRPSAHGAALGRLLARMVEAGGGAEMCATCAFREGSMPNLMAATGLLAMHCAIGTDPAPFGCHHGMQNELPTRNCAGWKAAQKAPFELWKTELPRVLADVRGGGEDAVRAEFDHWWPTVDPRGELDVHQLGRAWARRDSDGSPKGGDGEAGYVHDSAGPQDIAPEQSA